MTIKNSLMSRVGFGFIAVGLTVISAVNGYSFYRIILGVIMAKLITGVFEIGRLATLFRLFNSGKRKSLIIVLMYLIIAGVCAFASINAFTTEIILKSRKGAAYYNEQISRIKESYSKQVDIELKSLNQDINYLQNNVAKYGRSEYWRRRYDQFMIKRDKTVAERDKFVTVTPEDPEVWIQANAAKLGIKIDQKLVSDSEQIAVKIALKEFWGLKSIQVQKLIGIILTISIELLIVLLASLSKSTDPKKISQGAFELLYSKFGRRSIDKFIKLNEEYFGETGKLLPQSKLNSNLRPISLYLRNYDSSKLNKLFNKY